MPPPNLQGDRDIEHSWVAANLPDGSGLGLDFGSGDTNLALIAARRGFLMVATDRSAVNWWFEYPGFSFRRADALEIAFLQESLALVINCSTIEHLGLGRYGDRLDSEADLKGMEHLRSLLAPEGIMLLTIPVGMDSVYPRLHRVYGRTRLPLLLDGYAKVREEYWIKNADNRWVLVSEDRALTQPTTSHSYGLGCFVLSKTT
jgi:hypothetical protein